jgi:hypothetical protein
MPLPVMAFSRLDYDTNTAYPWQSAIGGIGGIALVGIHPVGTQDWVVAHIANDGHSGWLVTSRVSGDWRSGDPHSTLTVGPARYALIPVPVATASGWYADARLTGFYPSGGSGPAHVTFILVQGTGGGALDVRWHYCTYDLDTGTLTTVTSGEKSPADFSAAGYDLGLAPSSILACNAYNAHNKAIAVVWCPDAGYFTVGVIQPDTGFLSSPVQVQSSVSRGAANPIGYYPFNDLVGYLVGGQNISTFKWTTYLTDYSYYPPVVTSQVNPIAYWSNNPAKSQVIWAADSSYFAADVPGSGGALSVNPRSPNPFASCYFGHSITQGVTTSTRDSTWLVNDPLRQRMPVAGWPNGVGYVPHPLTNPPLYSNFITSWLGHVSPSDSSPSTKNTFAYPSAPLLKPFYPAATRPWMIGGLTFSPNPNVQGYIIYAANYDTNAGRAPTGVAPPYAPPLWAFGTKYGGGTGDYPLNLWAGAVN